MNIISPRFRSKDALSQETGNYAIMSNEGETSISGDFHSGLYDRKWELMTDTVGLLACDVNPVEHEKMLMTGDPCRAIPFNVFTALNLGLNTESGGQFGIANTGIYPLTLQQHLRALPLPPDVWFDDFAAKAEHHFRTAVNDTHSLINIILEMIQMCEGNVKKLSELLEKVQKALKTFWKMYEKTGDYWLSWNFGIKPMIGDVKAILNSLKNAQKRLEWLRKRNHLDTKVYYREGPWENEHSFTVPYILSDHVNEEDLIYMGNVDAYIKCEHRVTVNYSIQPASYAWVRFDIPDHLLEGFEGLGIVWASLAGLYNPLKVAWEATPYSWLADWFLSKRTQLLKELANISPLRDAEILLTGHSFKMKAFGKVSFWHTDPGPPPVQPYDMVEQGKAMDFQYTAYARKEGLPTRDASPFVVPFDWYKTSILLALLQQKTRRG